MSRRRLSTLGLLLLLSACADTATQPFSAPGGGNAAISDASHGENRNPFFFWLPPMVEQPASALLGEPEMHASPRVVVVCQASNQLASCDTTLAIESTVTSGTFADFTRGAGLEAASDLFQVDFDTHAFGLSAGVDTFYTTYRVVVYSDSLRDLGGRFVLGYADFQLGENGREAKNLTTDDVIGLVDGRTLPIKFRIDRGAYAYALTQAGGVVAPGEPADQPLCQENCTVAIVATDDTTTVTLEDAGGLEVTGVQFLPGVVSETSVLVIDERIAEGEDANCANGVTVQKKYCYRYRIFPKVSFADSVPFGICPREVPLDSTSLWRILKVDYDDAGAPIVTRPREVDVSSFLPCEGAASASLMNRLFRYALDNIAPPLYAQTSTRTWGGMAKDFSDLFWALDAAMTPVTTTDTAIEAGTTFPAIVRVEALYPEPDVPLDSARVTFRITGGDGWLEAPIRGEVVSADSANGHAVTITLLTDADGLGGVVMTTASGANTVEVTSEDALTPDLAPIVFEVVGEAAGFTVSGTLYYSQSPAEGVVAYISSIGQVNTDPQGHYELGPMPAGTYDLCFDGQPEYGAFCNIDLVVSDDIAYPDLYITKYIGLLSPEPDAVWASRSPTFVWQSLAEAATYTLWVFHRLPGLEVEMVEQVENLADTTYTITGELVPAEDYAWQVSAYDESGHPVGSPAAAHNFEIATTGSIAGTVTLCGSDPALGATVTLVEASKGTFTNYDGEYLFSSVTPGTYTVQAVVTGYAMGTATVVVNPGATAEADLHLCAAGQIAFYSPSRLPSTTYSVWAITPGGAGLHQVTDDVADDLNPAWSPDGLQIAFRSVSRGASISNAIWIINADGTSLRQLTDDATADFSPAWSPDGQQIAFQSVSRVPSTSLSIWVIGVDGTGLHQLTDDLGADYAPSWSPDGSRVVFQSQQRDGSPTYSIWVLNADGSGLHRLTDDAGQDYRPVWSPDGSRIAFCSYARGTSNTWSVWVMNADGSGLRQLTDDAAADYYPAWSPDGRQIAFHSFYRGSSTNVSIWVIDVDGSGLRRVTDDAAIDYGPSWSSH